MCVEWQRSTNRYSRLLGTTVNDFQRKFVSPGVVVELARVPITYENRGISGEIRYESGSFFEILSLPEHAWTQRMSRHVP